MPKLCSPTIYEIYPRSFLDTTGNGEGDLKGIADRLEYVSNLGVEAIWIAPFYTSRWKDGGYDVTDHCSVDPRLGTLDDFDLIIAVACDLGLAILVDLVFKHTSIDHPWFLASLAGDEAAAERYVWRNANPDGTPPTNWIGYFGMPAWSWHHQRQQYYLHQYHSDQPALNHRNADVQQKLREIMAFWKARGVAGFRFDAVTSWFHDPEFRDNPPASVEEQRHIDGVPASPYRRQVHRYDMLVNEGADYMTSIRKWAGNDLYLIGESNFGIASIDIALDYTGPDKLDGCYTTDTVRCGHSGEAWDSIFKKLSQQWRLPWWFESHDQARSPTNLGNGSGDSARFLAVLSAVLPGALLIYQGQELGLPQPDLEKAEVDDPFDLEYWPDGPGRSGARVPIPWDETPETFGFTSGEPWLPMRWQSGVSVVKQKQCETSVLAFYRDALCLRKTLRLCDPEHFEHHFEDGLMQVKIGSQSGKLEAIFNFSDAVRDCIRPKHVLLSVRHQQESLLPGGAILYKA